MGNTYANATGDGQAKRVVKRDPQLPVLWFQAIAYGCVFLFAIASIIAISSLSLPVKDAFDLGTNGAMAFTWSLLFLYSLLRLLYLLKLNRRRQAAARGDTRFLANWQLEMGMEGRKVASPLVIKYGFSWQNSLIFMGFILLAFVLIVGIYAVPYVFWGSETLGALSGEFGLILVCVVAIIFLLALVLGLWGVRNQSNIEVVAFSNGLLKKTPMKEQFVAWSDARLVAIDSKARIEGEQRPIMLEVASKDEMIQFPWVYQQRTWRTLFLFPQPVVPFDVYQEQMQALLRVIVGETRLPLYDLNKKEEK
jgi:hypothetical protein